jgi:hypothetical protein
MRSLDLRHLTTMHELCLRMRRGMAMIVAFAVQLSFKVKHSFDGSHDTIGSLVEQVTCIFRSGTACSIPY